MLLSEAWGKMIHEKNQKQKILWHYPFKLLGSGPTQLRCSPLFHQSSLRPLVKHPEKIYVVAR